MKPKQYPLLRLLRYTHNYRSRIILATIFSILNKLFDLAPPFLIGMAVDVIVAREDSWIAHWGFPDVMTQLWILAALTILVWVLESVSEYILEVLWRNLAQSIQHELRLDAYSHIQGLEMAYFEERSTGGLMAILNDDINQLERFLDGGANKIIQVIITVLIIGGMFFYVAPSVAWLAMLPMPFVIWGALYFQQKIAPRYAEVRERNSLMNAQLSNNLGGIATIKSFTAELHEIERIRQASDAYRDSNRRAIRLSSAFIPVIRMLILAGFTAILVYGGQLTLTGQLNVATYSVMVYIVQRLLWPLTELGQTVDLYQRAMASTTRVLDVLDTQPQITEGQVSLPVKQVQGELVFDRVSFEYGFSSNGHYSGNGRPPATIRTLSLRIPAGETVAIVGPTGAGKSTVIKLLLRFYDVQHGHIYLDGRDIRELRLADLRGAIGLVSQDVFLFHGTVRENIAYGAFNATGEQIIAAARIAEAHDFITELPQGYNTIVGERGQKLSGGQRQRLSIARAVLKNPPVLILDEATSSVDNETEAAIQRSLERIAIDRTTIVIAHRLSTVRNAHRIFVLDKGVLREQGRHEELIAANGLYAALWRVQTGERDQFYRLKMSGR